MELSYTTEILDYFNSKLPDIPMITVKTMQEGCAFAVEPVFKFISKGISSKIPSVEMSDSTNQDKEEKHGEIEQVILKLKENNSILILSSDFIKYFTNCKLIEMKLKGRKKKKIIFLNPKPILKNICKV